jgi:hypothetical protein
MIAALPVGWCLATLGAGEHDVLLPGTWKPVEVGIVRRAGADEEGWTEPQLMVALDWQPEGGRSINELSPADYTRVLNAAFFIFSRTRETLLLADNEPLQPHTTRAWRGHKRVHMYFPLPEGIPDKLELFIRTAAYTLGSFEAATTLTAGESEPFTISGCTWRLERVEPGRTPPKMPDDLPDVGPGTHAMTAYAGPCPETDQALRMIFVGDRHLREGVESFWLDEIMLKNGDTQWTPAAADLAQSGDPAGMPYLIMWFPLPPEALPELCELTMRGTSLSLDRDRAEETIHELPSPWVGP